ncbi:MAG TPA: thiamine pyrophosphate-dependent dehydrogenase E1 component subunit alpha [Pseudonocardiaceae bacterium]
MTAVDAARGTGATSRRAPGRTVDHDLALLDTMLRIRFFEEIALELTSRGDIVGALHPYTGHEAIAAGVARHVGRDDQVVSYYRCHGHALATGLDPFEMFAELLGRATGVNRGKGGSMHLAQRSRNFFGGNSIVGANVGIAAGMAAGLRIRGRRAAAIVFLGDGATGAGVVLETLRIAAHQRLPLLLVCENNAYQDRTPSRLVSTVPPAAVAAGLGVPAETVDGNDVTAVDDVAGRLLPAVRDGDGPRFVEATTYLRDFHCQWGELPPAEYRPPAEVALWRERDPIERLERSLLARGMPAARLRAGRERVRAERRRAATAALAEPEPHPAEATEHLTARPWPTGGW